MKDLPMTIQLIIFFGEASVRTYRSSPPISVVAAILSARAVASVESACNVLSRAAFSSACMDAVVTLKVPSSSDVSESDSVEEDRFFASCIPVSSVGFPAGSSRDIAASDVTDAVDTPSSEASSSTFG